MQTPSNSVAVLPRQLLLPTIFVGLLYLAGNLSTGIYPIFVMSMIAGGHATMGNIGVLATAEFLPFGLAIMFAGRFLAERPLRKAAGVCLSIHLLASYLTTRLPFEALIFCRAIFGIAGGTLIWMAYAYIARSMHAGRLVAIFATILMMVGLFWSWLCPVVMVPRFGHEGVIIAMTAPSLLALILLPFGPNHLLPLPAALNASGEVVSGWVPLPSLLVLLTVGMWSVFVTIFWVYSEPLAAHRTGELVHHWLSISLVFQMLGAAASALLAERIPYRSCVTFGLLISIAQVVSIILGVGSLGFVAWTAIYGFFSYFLFPFYVAALVQMDPSRRSIVYLPAAQNLAGSLGPVVVAEFVSGTDLSAGLTIDLAAIIIAPFLFWAAQIVYQRRLAPAVALH